MDFELIAALGAKLEWVSDTLRLSDIKPRHIGRVVTFDHLIGEEPGDGYDYVIGTLDGAVGHDLLVSGELYNYSYIANLRSWRREIKHV
jgi:hypothetical protein